MEYLWLQGTENSQISSSIGRTIYYVINQGSQGVALGLASSEAVSRTQVPSSFQLCRLLSMGSTPSSPWSVQEGSTAPSISTSGHRAQKQKDRKNVSFFLLLLYKTQDTFSRSSQRIFFLCYFSQTCIPCLFLDQLLAKEMDWLSSTSGFLFSSNIYLCGSGLSWGTGDLLFVNS